MNVKSITRWNGDRGNEKTEVNLSEDSVTVTTKT